MMPALSFRIVPSRMFDPPPVTVAGHDLRDVLAPAYDLLASQ